MKTILIATMLITWCDDFPRAPAGLFCVGPERITWRFDESATPPLVDGDRLLRAHHIEVIIVPVPDVKPEPPPRPEPQRNKR